MADYILCNKTITSEETTRPFVNNIYKYHGLPDDIISDRGMQFTSKFRQSLFKILQVKIKFFLKYYPQTDGICESNKLNESIKFWSSICDVPSTIIKTIDWIYWYLQSLPTITLFKNPSSRFQFLLTMVIIQD